jgi:hypothetical protein
MSDLSRLIVREWGRPSRAAVATQHRPQTSTTNVTTLDDTVAASSVDVVVIDGDRARELLARAAEVLVPGGHAILVPGSGDREHLRKLARDAGFEVMHRHHKLVVARLAPEPGKLSLTVGMLTLNERESVARMIDEIRAVAPDAKILLIDSSTDDTPDIAKASGAEVIRQVPARGHGPAMERLMYAAAERSDALIYIDCDFTYPTSYIPRVRELLEQGADVVNATRTHRYPKAMPIPNFIANRTFAGVARIIHGIPTTDLHSGLRGYRSSTIRAFSFDGERDALPVSTLIHPARANYHVVDLPIPYAERVGVSKLAKLRGTMWTFARILSEIPHGKRVRAGRNYSHVQD